MKILKIKRQGDVYVHKVDEIPSEIKTKMQQTSEVTLALGEVTGHSHRVIVNQGLMANMYQTPERDTYLEIPEAGSRVVHEDHAHFDLEEGSHFSQIQEEYDPLLERRKVQD